MRENITNSELWGRSGIQKPSPVGDAERPEICPVDRFQQGGAGRPFVARALKDLLRCEAGRMRSSPYVTLRASVPIDVVTPMQSRSWG